MMILYSGSTDPFSHRCRFLLYEKGCDFEIIDVDLYNKPPEIDALNPYGEVPILVERELTLYESTIIDEYIDERFPHPQLMPADPIQRAPVCSSTRSNANSLASCASWKTAMKRNAASRLPATKFASS